MTSDLQIESFRLWLVVVSFGFDTECFSYLFPVFSSFPVGFELNLPKASLFAAFETFIVSNPTIVEDSRLKPLIKQAQQTITRCIDEEKKGTVREVETALRFLSAVQEKGKMVERTRLESFIHVLNNQNQSSILYDELLLTILRFINGNQKQMESKEWMHLIPFLESYLQGITTRSCTMVCPILAQIACLVQQPVPISFIYLFYQQTLLYVSFLPIGFEYWMDQLFKTILFNSIVLKQLSFQPLETSILLSVYQTLFHLKEEKEQHSFLLFSHSTEKNTCQLIGSASESESILPLPQAWMFKPFSHLEYHTSSKEEDPLQEQIAVIQHTCAWIIELEKNKMIQEMNMNIKLYSFLHVFLIEPSHVLMDIEHSLETLLALYTQTEQVYSSLCTQVLRQTTLQSESESEEVFWNQLY